MPLLYTQFTFLGSINANTTDRRCGERGFTLKVEKYEVMYLLYNINLRIPYASQQCAQYLRVLIYNDASDKSETVFKRAIPFNFKLHPTHLAQHTTPSIIISSR